MADRRCPECGKGRLRTAISVSGGEPVQIQREDAMCRCGKGSAPMSDYAAKSEAP